MASRRGSSSCALCEGSNLPSCCALCVNARLLEYHTKLRMMRSLRDSLHARIAARLEAKSKTDEQRIWRASKAHDIMELRDRLTELKSKTAVDKTKVEQASSGLKAKTASLNLALVTLKKRQADAVAMHTSAMEIAQMNLVIKEGEKKDNYSGPYDSICGARLPRGLDPHSIPAEELSASLGTCYTSSILRSVSYLRPFFMYQALRVHAQIYGSGVPTGVHDSPRARFTLFLYLGKMLAQAVKKPHCQKVVRVTSELTLWILSRNSLLVPREVIALTSLVHLPTPWRGINICREEYHY
ncbi:DNA-directed RNA polymerase II protein [Zea mays]|uniref:DNA-directed RNA polymerase II protein n=1 Tax=Zea mays TaxID=4577 RepID=A0A1D6IKB6_MAIZE|nr:DNA-directed RNA polymerase II protein [Zea mays]